MDRSILRSGNSSFHPGGGGARGRMSGGELSPGEFDLRRSHGEPSRVEHDFPDLRHCSKQTIDELKIQK